MIVYVGYDTNEALAFKVAQRSIRAYNPTVPIQRLILQDLTHKELYWRPTEKTTHGSLWDSISGAPMSTEFAISRFLVPILQNDGFAVFIDCDVVVNCDIEEILDCVDSRYAVSVVKHDYHSSNKAKMGGLPNNNYPRKNWSSVMVFNCEHPANRRLRLSHVNTLYGRDLHRFCWLKDEEIGELPPAWNWLVNEQPQPGDWKIAHFTLGGPWIPRWTPAPHDDIWLEAVKEH